MQFETQTLIIDGLVEHWGKPDPTLNQDLVDIGRSYAGDVFLVAVDENDRVIGTGALRFGDQGTGQVVRMSVATGSRRLGIGQRILDALVAEARSRGLSSLILETTASWRPVRDFYEKSGFVFTHDEVGSFGPDAWYERRL